MSPCPLDSQQRFIICTLLVLIDHSGLSVYFCGFIDNKDSVMIMSIIVRIKRGGVVVVFSILVAGLY